MIITISGDPGSGKSTVAKELAKRLGYKHYSGGDMRGLLAVERGITIDELNKIGEKEGWTDKDIDDRIARLGREKDNFVIDSRLAWHFIKDEKEFKDAKGKKTKHVVRIYLSCDTGVASDRIFNARKTEAGREDEPLYKSAAEAEKELKARVASDVKRYKKYYGIDHTDKKHYDLTLETSCLTQEQAAEQVLAFVKRKGSAKR
jgi:cytidylate kinase